MTPASASKLGTIASFVGRHAFAAIAAAVAAALIGLGFLTGWRDLLLTPDQHAMWAMRQGNYKEAAERFSDPLWRGVALFRAGAFKDAAQALSGLDTPDAAYDQGNALVMLGRYDDAVARYEHALTFRPGWADAEANRQLARLRAERMKTQGGDTGNTDSKPDQVVFDPNAPKAEGGKDQEAEGGAPMSDEAVRALWLRGVQTRPADFLRAKFGYQLANRTSTPAAAPAPGEAKP